MLCEAILDYLLRVARTAADRSTIYGNFEIESPVYSVRSLRQPASASSFCGFRPEKGNEAKLTEKGLRSQDSQYASTTV